MLISIWKGFLVFLSGFCLGWLTGLSLSPVVEVVIGGAVGVIGAVVSALSGVAVKRDDNGDQGDREAEAPKVLMISPVPMAVFILGVAIAAPIGILARTHEWFSRTPEEEVKTWEKLKIKPEEVAKRLFEHAFPTYSAKAEEPKNPPGGGLYTISANERDQLRTLRGENLRNFMAASQHAIFVTIANQISDTPKLEQAAKDLADVLYIPDTDH